MQKLNFFRKGIFALLVAATALVACSKDSDDNEFKYTNTVTLNGVEKKITRAEYEENNSNYRLFLYLDESNENVLITLNEKLHMNGSSISLNQKENEHKNGENYWGITYSTTNNTTLFYTTANPTEQAPLFQTGTLTVSRDPENGTFNIKLENGNVKGFNDNKYTLTLNYSGKMEKRQ